MKFGSDQAARRRVLEAGQQYRGMTFTDRGKLLLDVGSVQDGRVTLSQHGRSIRLLPETLSGIHRAWQDGDIPLDGKDNWECSTFSPGVSDADQIAASAPQRISCSSPTRSAKPSSRLPANSLTSSWSVLWILGWPALARHIQPLRSPNLLARVPAGIWIRRSQRRFSASV